MEEGKEEEAPGLPGKDIGVQLIKELTISNFELVRMLRSLIVTIGGAAPTEDYPEGVAGLLESNASLAESLTALDDRMVGISLKVTALDYVLDRLAEIAQGNPTAEPPIEPRTVTWHDAIDAKREYEAKLEEEELKNEADVATAIAEEEADRKKAEGQGPTLVIDLPKPKKPPMISNLPKAPTMTPMPEPPKAETPEAAVPKKADLPPLPVAAPKPGEPK